MEQIRREYQEGGFIEAEMAKRQKTVAENLGPRGLIKHAGNSIAEQTKSFETAPIAITIGVGTEVRINGTLHILVKPGPTAGLWYNTEGDLIDVSAAAKSDKLNTIAYRENPDDIEAKETYEQKSSAEAMRELSREMEKRARELHAHRIQKRISKNSLFQGFIRKTRK